MFTVNFDWDPGHPDLAALGAHAVRVEVSGGTVQILDYQLGDNSGRPMDPSLLRRTRNWRVWRHQPPLARHLFGRDNPEDVKLDSDLKLARGVSLISQGKCLDAPQDQLNQDGARIKIWDCWDGVNQQWLLLPDGTARIGDKCLTAPRPDQQPNQAGGQIVFLAPEFNARLETCSGDSRQKWRPQPDGSIRLNGKCLTVSGEQGNTNGAPVELVGCDGGENQKWTTSVTPPREDEEQPERPLGFGNKQL